MITLTCDHYQYPTKDDFKAALDSDINEVRLYDPEQDEIITFSAALTTYPIFLVTNDLRRSWFYTILKSGKGFVIE